MLKGCGCIGIFARNKKPVPPLTDEQWADWEAKAELPHEYDPPQKRCGFDWGKCFGVEFGACPMCPVKTPCPCCVPCCRCALFSGLGLQQGSISDPDPWFKQMLSRVHPNCPKKWQGIWWMMDNVAAEALFTIADGEWSSPRRVLKTARYNWTVDAQNLWGVALTQHFWTRLAELDFAMSPSGKWLHIAMVGQDQHFAYIVQEGDVIKRPDGTVVETNPGEDFIRVSYKSRDSNSKNHITYQYLTRRVAYLDDNGNLVKTKAYDDLLRAATETSKCCRGGVDQHVYNLQEFTLTPMSEQASPAGEAASAEAPPAQQSMV